MVPVSTAPTRVPTGRQGSDFAELSRAVQRSGLLERRYAYYAMTSGLAIAAFVATWVVFVAIGDSWWQLLTAVVLAVVSTQLSFMGHDAGHKQIFRGRRANDAVGYVHAGLVGLSYGWWVGKHNRHHANPNHEDDPDLDIPVLAFSVDQAQEKRGFVRWTVANQAVLFFPLLLLEGFSLHWTSVDAAWRGDLRRAGLEKTLLIANIGAYLAAVFLVLSPLQAIAFIAVHKGLWGLYMGCSFAPNHKGMEMLVDGHDLDFLRKQVLTSRNVRGGQLVDVALGGLNYQIEHHLFPSVPRPNLRHLQPIVRAFCVERGISYSETGLLSSYGHVLRHLHAVGAPLRTAATKR